LLNVERLYTYEIQTPDKDNKKDEEDPNTNVDNVTQTNNPQMANYDTHQTTNIQHSIDNTISKVLN